MVLYLTVLFFNLVFTLMLVHFPAMCFQEIEEVDTDEHYRPKSSIGIIDVKLELKV